MTQTTTPCPYGCEERPDADSKCHVCLADALVPKQGYWVPACGGSETPFRTRTGKTLLYCWNPVTGAHGYLDCGTDIILSDEEAQAALAVY